jgi:dipeptidyl aminopeptidase/acylaminoacyl peptidase
MTVAVAGCAFDPVGLLLSDQEVGPLIESGPDYLLFDYDPGELLRVMRADHTLLDGYVRRPAATDRHTAVLVLHGSSPQFIQTSTDHAAWFGLAANRYLTEAGYTIVSLDYPEMSSPLLTGDLAAALYMVDWLQQHGPELFGTHRLYVLGLSRGAILAQHVNLYRVVDGVVSLSAVTDFEALDLDDFGNDENISDMVSLARAYYGEYDEAPEVWRQLSTVNRVDEMLAGMLVVHGTADETVPVDQALRLERAVRQNGRNDITFHYASGAGHWAFMLPEVHQTVEKYLTELDEAD